MSNRAVILLNIGTPDKPEKREVRKYLSEFLNDGRIIDIPLLFRKILVNLIIVPFRTSKSTKLYKLLWKEKGSPLLFLTKSLESKLQNILGENYTIYAGMRYGNPSVKNILYKIRKKNYDEIILVPLFPQYASSTTGSLLEHSLKVINDWDVLPRIRTINQFYDSPEFIDSIVYQFTDIDFKKYDHIVFSYHGLPISHIEKIHTDEKENTCKCESIMPAHGKYCYKATCYETTRLVAEKLKLNKEKYSVSFQSRLTKNWLKPFTDETLISLAKNGKKKVLILAPSFVTDCLETNVELGILYKDIFIKHGGEELFLLPCLNDSDKWALALSKIILK